MRFGQNTGIDLVEDPLEVELSTLQCFNGGGQNLQLTFDVYVESIRKIVEQYDPVVDRCRDVFSEMMSTQRKQHANRSACEKRRLPERRQARTGKDELHNKLIDYCIDNDICIVKHILKESRDSAWSLLVDILWRLNGVGIQENEWSTKPPEDLKLFLGFSFYDKSKEKGKRKRPSLTQEVLSKLQMDVQQLQKRDWLVPSSLKMINFLDGLLRSFTAQLSTLLDKAQQTSTRRVVESYNSIWKDITPSNIAKKYPVQFKPIAPSKPTLRYKALNRALAGSDTYRPLMLYEYISGPMSRANCFKFRESIKVEFNALVVNVKHGGSIRDDLWIFKTDPSSPDHDQKVYEATKKCIDSSSTYVDGWVQKAFQNLLIPGCHDHESIALFRHFCAAFLGDETQPSTKHYSHQQALLEISIQTGDHTLLEDARKLNRRPVNEAFKEFWELTGEYLNAVADAAHARRHGQAEVGYLSEILSAPDLHRTITDKLKVKMGEDFNEDMVPSLSSLYLQFMPSSNKMLTAMRFKSRFSVQMKIQKRILHIDHIDAHYGNAIIRYLRSFAVRFKGLCSFFSADDKARMIIGPPGVFLQSGVRNKPQLTHSDVDLLALDHDYDGTCLVPSVYLKHHTPENLAGDWYKGKVSVGIKDGVFQKSCPWRHAEELQRQYEKYQTPLLMLLTDGGPDRMLKRATVMAAHISLFLKLDLDMLIVARTVPYLSFRNPCERVMSVLNLGLQNVSLTREDNETLEEELKGCNSMGSIREKAKRFPGGEAEFQALFNNSLTKAIGSVSDRMARLQWKEEDITTYPAGDLEDIGDLIETFLKIDENFSSQFKDKCTRMCSIDWTEFMRRGSPVKEFISKHVRQSPYVLQIKKIQGCNCKLCASNIIKPCRMDSSTFNDICWLPLPLKKANGEDGKIHYKDFDDLYGTEPNHSDQPSLKSSKASSKGEHGLYTASRAKSFLTCSHCAKPRVIYMAGSQQRLTKEEKGFIQQVNEGNRYVCGSEIPKTDHIESRGNEVVNSDNEDSQEAGGYSGEHQFFLRDGLTCETPVESTYFFSQGLSTKRNLRICSHCGLGENHIQLPTQEELDTYGKVFHPCGACKRTIRPTPKPYKGSLRKRKRDFTASTNTAVAIANTRGAEEEDGTVDPHEEPDTDPSGDFSEYSD